MVQLLEHRSPGAIWDGFGLTITISKRDALRASADLLGDIDLASAPILQACLQCEVAEGRRYLQLDLSAVTFVDCAGLNVILAAHHDLLARRGTLILTGASARARRLVRLAQLDRVLFIAAEIAVPVTVA
jgi:anti-anti-sigma factor